MKADNWYKIVGSALAVSITTAAVIFLIMARVSVHRLNDEIAELTALLSGEKQGAETVLSENQRLSDEVDALQGEVQALRAELRTAQDEAEALLIELAERVSAEQYRLTFHVPDDRIVAIDQRLEQGLVEVISAHLRAIGAGDEDAFRSTLAQQEDDHLLEIFTRMRNSDADVTAITLYDPSDEHGNKTVTGGNAVIAVSVRRGNEIEDFGSLINVAKTGEVWAVTGYS